MSLKRRVFSREFKLQVLQELDAGKSLAEVGRQYQVQAGTIVGWRKQQERYQDQSFAGSGHAYTTEAKVAELERIIGQLTVENALLKKALSRLKEQSRPSGGNGCGK